MKLDKNYVVKNILGNVVVIPIAQAYMDNKKIIQLDTEGTFFIKHIAAKKSEDEIIDLYSDLFSEDLETAKEKLEQFLQYGKDNGFIE